MPVRSPTDSSESTDPGASSPVRKLFYLAVGLVAVAYLVRRYVGEDRSGLEAVRERLPASDEIDEEVADEFRPIPIDGHGDAGPSSDAAEALDDETAVDMTDDPRSPEEITERADEEVPEPGEMAVGEDVADELVDEDERDGDEPDHEDDANEDEPEPDDGG